MFSFRKSQNVIDVPHEVKKERGRRDRYSISIPNFFRYIPKREKIWCKQVLYLSSLLLLLMANPPLTNWYGIIPKPKISSLKLPSSTPFSRSPITIRLFPPCLFTPFRRTIIPLKFSRLYASNSQCTWRLSLSHNVVRSFVPITN